MKPVARAERYRRPSARDPDSGCFRRLRISAPPPLRLPAGWLVRPGLSGPQSGHRGFATSPCFAQNKATLQNLDAQIPAQRAPVEQASQQVTEAEAALKFATDENTRYQDLVQKGAGTVQRAQQASSDFNGKQAAFDAANAAKVSAERQIDVLNAQKIGAAAQLDQAKAQKDRADADLQRTELRATVDGRGPK